MNDSDELRQALRSAIPETPQTHGWADNARQRSRRRRATVAGGAAVVVLGAGAVVPSAMNLAADSRPAAQIEQAYTTDTVAQEPNPCAEPDVPQVAALPLRATGAKIWLCMDSTAEGRMALMAPVEPLTEGAEQVIEQINGLPVWPTDAACELGPDTQSYRLIVLYDDGERITLTGNIDCGSLDQQAGANSVLTSLVNAMTHQRQGRQPVPTSPTTNPCGAAISVMPMVLQAQEKVYLCPDGGSTSTELTGADAQTVLDDLVAQTTDFATGMATSTPAEPDADTMTQSVSPQTDPVELAFENAGGEVHRVTIREGVAYLPTGAEAVFEEEAATGLSQWQPSQSVLQLLASK